MQIKSVWWKCLAECWETCYTETIGKYEKVKNVLRQ